MICLSAIHGPSRVHLQSTLRQMSPILTSLSSPLSTAPSSKKKKKKAATPTATFKEMKLTAKDSRRTQWEARQDRKARLPFRRVGKPRDVKLNAFQSWFEPRKSFQEMMEKKAKKSGKEWKIKVAVIVERLPVVTPDSPQWEDDFRVLRKHLLQWHGRDYPHPFEEENAEHLPDEFPAPDPLARITPADKSGDVKTLDRKLPHRVFFSIPQSSQQEQQQLEWGFPTTELESEETLLQAAQRVLKEAAGESMTVFCPGNAPMAVDLKIYEEDASFFGEKLFFMRVQHDRGDVDEKTDDWAWLTREEMVEKVKDAGGTKICKFYHYLL